MRGERSGDAGEARLIGWRLRRVREDRNKPLRVIAGLAGMSHSTLQRIESGQRPVGLVELARLADALEVPPSELTVLPVPAPANGHTDSTIEAVRRVLDGVEAGYPGGLVVPVEVLAEEVARLHAQRRACRFAEVATDLPGLIRNLHTTLATGLATGQEHGELLQLAVYLHVHVTLAWLGAAAAPTDLRRRVAFLAWRLAEEHGDVAVLGMAGFSVATGLLVEGASQPGRAVLESLALPPATAATAGLVCKLAETHALAAVVDGRPDEAAEPMATAEELAGRFGVSSNTDSLGFVLAPADAGIERMWLALNAGDPDQVVRIAENVHPERHPFPSRRSEYWRVYGCGLAWLRGRHEEAVRALRTAEQIYPTMVRRDPLVREAIGVLLSRTRRSSEARQELERMAFRAGLPV